MKYQIGDKILYKNFVCLIRNWSQTQYFLRFSYMSSWEGIWENADYVEENSSLVDYS